MARGWWLKAGTLFAVMHSSLSGPWRTERKMTPGKRLIIPGFE